MPQHASDDLQTQARRELWSFAFFRLESALVIGATIVLTGLSVLGAPWLPGSWPLWLGVGVAARSRTPCKYRKRQKPFTVNF